MLTLILLVVLGGGVAFVAVSLAESSKPATDAGGRRREAGRPAPPDESDEPSDPEPQPAPGPAPPAGPASAPAPAAAAPSDHADPLRRTAPAPTAVIDPGPPRRRSRGDVPAAYTAVEGRHRDVARAPWWRRLVSLVLIVVIAVLCGVVIAAVLGAVIGATAEIVGNTIG